MKEEEYLQAIDPDRKEYDYRVLTAYDAMQPQPPIEWVVGGNEEDLISRGSLSVFYGEPGSLKTWSMIALSVSVALGREWLDIPTTQTKVLYIDEESGETWFSRRLQKAIQGQLGDEETPIEFVCNAGFMLDDKNDIAEIEALITRTGAGLVIFDALTDIMSGDENSKKDVQPILTKLKKIADATQAAIIVIHHSAKHGGYRGSSAIKGAADLLIKIESKPESDWIKFTAEKVRNIEFITFSGLCTWTEDQFYIERRDDPPVLKPLPKSQKYVIKYLKNNGPSTISDIMTNADMCSDKAARGALYELVKDGKAYRTNPGTTGRGHEAIYDLVQQDGDDQEDEKWYQK